MTSSLFMRPYTVQARTTAVVRSRSCASLAVIVLAAVWSATTVVAQTSQVTDHTAHLAGAPLDVFMPEFGHGMRTIPDRAATVVVDDELQEAVDDLLRRSPTFRRQWRRVVRNPRLVIRIQLVHRSPVVEAHAATQITALPNGSLVADVAIPGGARLAELLGHEVEHVLERLDGARVAAQHALGDASVRRASGSFETARAVLVGRLVSTEYQTRQ